jgi:hypothetical protein
MLILYTGLKSGGGIVVVTPGGCQVSGGEWVN